MSGFTKLFSEIITSSIWGEDDKTRLVWITMLASCDAQGVVRASLSGLSHIARVNRGACKRAIDVLISPDPDSRSPEFDGRRIEKCDGGWSILNYSKYREARQKDERKAYMTNYMREYRSKHVNTPVNNVNDSKQMLAMLAKAEAEAEADSVVAAVPLTPHKLPEETKQAAAATAMIEELTEKHGIADIEKDFELSVMEPVEAMAMLEREDPDIDVWNEFRKLKLRCEKDGNKPTWRGFVAWLRTASPVAKIPKRTKSQEVLSAPNPEQERESRNNAMRTLKEWRESGVSYQGIKKQLNGQGEAS